MEFLPLHCASPAQLWVLHPLRHVDLAHAAVHNATNGSNITVVRRYAFDIHDLKGKHLFGVKQAMGSPTRKWANYVSEEFKRCVAANDLQGSSMKMCSRIVLRRTQQGYPTAEANRAAILIFSTSRRLQAAPSAKSWP